MKKIEWADLIVGIFWLILGTVMSYESVRLDLGSLRRPESGLIPFMIASFLEILAVILIIKTLSPKGRKETAREALLGEHWKIKGTVVIGLIVYSIVLPIMGYLISTFLLLSFLFNISGMKRWYLRVIGAAVLVSLTSFVFGDWLGCPLPMGIFGVYF